MSIDKNNYSTLSIDLRNPPVVNLTPDDRVTYAIILAPQLDHEFKDWRQYQLGWAASALDRFMLGQIHASIARDGDPLVFSTVIASGNPSVSTSASLEFSELDSAVREGSSRANR